MHRHLMCHRPQQAEVLHRLRHAGQVFANLDTGHAGCDRLELTANLMRSLRLQIKQIDMTGTAEQKHKDALPVSPGSCRDLLRSCEYLSERSSERNRSDSRQPVATRNERPMARCRMHRHNPGTDNAAGETRVDQEYNSWRVGTGDESRVSGKDECKTNSGKSLDSPSPVDRVAGLTQSKAVVAGQVNSPC